MPKVSDFKNQRQLILTKVSETLYQRLRVIVDLQPNMRFVDQIIGFTKNTSSTTIESVVRGDFHPFGNVGDKVIVVYALAKYVHCGLLYGEDDYVIQPIDVDEFESLLRVDATELEFFDRFQCAIEELDKLIGTID